jgi:hypothetical protein
MSYVVPTIMTYGLLSSSDDQEAGVAVTLSDCTSPPSAAMIGEPVSCRKPRTFGSSCGYSVLAVSAL